MMIIIERDDEFSYFRFEKNEKSLPLVVQEEKEGNGAFI